MSAFEKIFGTHSERELKRIKPIVDKVESYHEAMGKLSDDELKDKTKEFKKRLADGETHWKAYRSMSRRNRLSKLVWEYSTLNHSTPKSGLSSSLHPY